MYVLVVESRDHLACLIDGGVNHENPHSSIYLTWCMLPANWSAMIACLPFCSLHEGQTAETKEINEKVFPKVLNSGAGLCASWDLDQSVPIVCYSMSPLLDWYVCFGLKKF